MKQFAVSKCHVELTKDSLMSVISSKLNACGREVLKCFYMLAQKILTKLSYEVLYTYVM